VRRAAAGQNSASLRLLGRDGLITASINRMRAGAKLINVKRVRITEPGTQVLGGRSKSAGLSAVGGRPAVGGDVS
jgi:hypothetical protein